MTGADDDLLDEVLTEGEKPSASPSVSTSKEKRKRRKSGPAEPDQPPGGDGSGRASKCPFYAPRGTTCKFCGKVHPL